MHAPHLSISWGRFDWPAHCFISSVTKSSFLPNEFAFKISIHRTESTATRLIPRLQVAAVPTEKSWLHFCLWVWSSVTANKQAKINDMAASHWLSLNTDWATERCSKHTWKLNKFLKEKRNWTFRFSTPPSHKLCVSKLVLHPNNIHPLLLCIQEDFLFVIRSFCFSTVPPQTQLKLDPPVDLHEGQWVESKFTSGVFKTSWRETRICFLWMAENWGYGHICTGFPSQSNLSLEFHKQSSSRSTTGGFLRAQRIQTGSEREQKFSSLCNCHFLPPGWPLTPESGCHLWTLFHCSWTETTDPTCFWLTRCSFCSRTVL